MWAGQPERQPDNYKQQARDHRQGCEELTVIAADREEVPPPPTSERFMGKVVPEWRVED